MSLGQQIATCAEHYSRWKERAQTAADTTEIRKAVDRAFFWLELQSAFVVLHAIEQTKGGDTETRKKLIVAKANLSKKLADYAKEILSEL